MPLCIIFDGCFRRSIVKMLPQNQIQRVNVDHVFTLDVHRVELQRAPSLRQGKRTDSQRLEILDEVMRVGDSFFRLVVQRWVKHFHMSNN